MSWTSDSVGTSSPPGSPPGPDAQGSASTDDLQGRSSHPDHQEDFIAEDGEATDASNFSGGVGPDRDRADDLAGSVDGSVKDALDGDSDDEDDAADRTGIDLDPMVLARERDEYLGALQRLQADFENYKKRVQRQQVEAFGRAGEDLAVKLLPVLDTIDLARQHGEGDAVAPLATALLDALTKEGLERIDPVGEAFDPNEHEAVSHEEGNGDSGDEPVVTGLMRAGYRWKGRLVRPAMVTVKG